MSAVFEGALHASRGGLPAALVTVVSTEGSTPQKAGARMLVHPDGTLVGTIGGGCVEAEMTRRARQALLRRRCELASYDLTPEQAGEDGLVCGGRMLVFIEPLTGPDTLCLFGAGHVAQPLAQLAKLAGFRVEVLDDRPKFANVQRFPDADLVLVDDIASGAARLTLGANTYVVVVTRGHKGDADALAAVLGRGLRYVGLLGSKPKMVHVFSALQKRGVPAAELARVHTPVGLRIGAETPEEIAVSILAELIAVRHGIDPATSGSLKAELPGRLKVGA